MIPRDHAVGKQYTAGCIGLNWWEAPGDRSDLLAQPSFRTIQAEAGAIRPEGRVGTSAHLGQPITLTAPDHISESEGDPARGSGCPGGCWQALGSPRSAGDILTHVVLERVRAQSGRRPALAPEPAR